MAAGPVRLEIKRKSLEEVKVARHQWQFHSVRNEGGSSIVGLLKTCAKQKDLCRGTELHAFIREHKFLETNCYIASSLVSMYARCGAIAKAQELLDELSVRDAVSWTALIAAYAQQGHPKDALECFDVMQFEGHSPDAVTFTCTLKACGSVGALTKGEHIHDMVLSLHMLKKDIVLGNSLVDMYVKCGVLAKAQQVLDELPVKSTVMWNTLMAGYAQQGLGDEALKCFDNMQHEGQSPDAVTFICALKACGSIGAAAVKVQEIHDMIIGLGILDKDIVLGNTLVDTYAKCGALAKAEEVLIRLPVRDVITWTSLITGYTQQGRADEALKCFDSMQHEGHYPDVVTFISALKACGSIRCAVKGKKIHDMIVSLGMLEKDIALGNTLVDMYARCGALTKAQQVLSELPVRNVIAWNALIAGYVQQGHAEEALKCFDSMQREGHFPDLITFICALKACGSMGAMSEGEKIHDMIVSLGFLGKDIVLANTLIDMYARCGALVKARKVLEELPARDVITWTALIVGYVQHGHGEEALKCFDNMLNEGYSPDVVTFISALKACGTIGASARGEKIHDMVVSSGLLETDIVLGNTLVDMYARCGALIKAQQLLNELPVRNVVTWNALISGYIQQDQGEEALKSFDNMETEGHFPDVVTYICALKACGITRHVARGKQIHDRIVGLGILETNIALGNTLVDMYARCGTLATAQQVLNELPVRDSIAWTTLIAGYVQQGHAEEALECFDKMQHEGHTPDAVTFACALKACGSVRAAIKGQEIHDKMVSLGMLEKDIMLGNSLVDMYARCGALIKARQVLSELPAQNVITWTSLIAGYVEQGLSEEALKCFESMQHEGHSPNAVTFVFALKACGSLGATAKGEEVHEKIVKLGLLGHHVVLGNTLLDMYVKCGSLAKAAEVLEELPAQDVVTWNTLIGGYAQQGQSGDLLKCFEGMQSKGIMPDSTTFVCTINAYSHWGILDQAEVYFSKMSATYGIAPNLEHYCCMVDLFGRAGEFKKALMAIENMQSIDHLPAWLALLGACCKWGDMKIGRMAFKRALQLAKEDTAAYVCMANMYTTAGMGEDADEIEVMRITNEAQVLDASWTLMEM